MLRKIAFAVVAFVAIAAVTQRAAAQDQPAPAPPPQEAPRPIVSSGDPLIDLNEAIRIYLADEEDKEDARRLLLLVLERDPENDAARYFLGLVYLQQGLAASQTGDKETATAKFEEASKALEQVKERADPTLVPVESAVELGIAQLGSEREGESTKEGLVRSRKAAETLSRYVTETDAGKNDRYGYFFLAVAHYRLADRKRGEDLKRSADEFAQALDLARQDVANKKLDQSKLDEFETIVLYYQGLIDLISDNRPAALEKMQLVVSRGVSGKLAVNAEQLITFIKTDVQARPAGIVLPVPPPIGPLQFEATLSIGTYYDTNVILLGRDTELPHGITKKDDFRLGVEAGFDVTRSFVKADGILGETLQLGVGGSTFHFWQPSIGEFDINNYTGRTYANWEFIEDFFAGIEYDYTYTQLGHDPYISSNRLTAALIKAWRHKSEQAKGEEFARTSLFYSYDYRDYKDLLRDFRFDRDGKYHAIGVNQIFNLSKARDLWPDYYAQQPDGAIPDYNDSERTLDVRFGYLYRDERTHGDEFDLVGHTISAGVNVPLPWRLIFDLSADFTWDDYNNPSLISYTRETREDFIQRYTAGLTRILIAQGENERMKTLDMRIRGGIEITYQDSNIWDRIGEDVYEFNRFIYSLQLQIRF